MHVHRVWPTQPMDPIHTLPDSPLPPGDPLADAFIARGAATFHDACQLVKALPYGSDISTTDPLALLEDGCGTCVTKHGTIARLAAVLQLPVYKNLGFYRLTDDIITGVGALLEPYGLTFVPTSHCFLESGPNRVDLTAGNRTGKNRDVEAFDIVVRVAPVSSSEVLQRLHSQYFAQCAAIEPRLAELGETAVRDLARRGHELAAQRRAQPVATVSHVPARA